MNLSSVGVQWPGEGVQWAAATLGKEGHDRGWLTSISTLRVQI
jgi:hypothetical protein